MDLVNLSKYHTYLKLMIDGVASEPFSATTLPPVPEPIDYKEVLEKVIKVSHERYCTKREIIEDKIMRWSNMEAEEGESSGKETPARSYNKSGDDQIKVVATCDNCGKKTMLNFEPDLNKPIYCKDCLKKIHQRKQNNQDRSGESSFERSVAEQKPVSLKEALGSNTRDFKSGHGRVTLEGSEKN